MYILYNNYNYNKYIYDYVQNEKSSIWRGKNSTTHHRLVRRAQCCGSVYDSYYETASTVHVELQNNKTNDTLLARHVNVVPLWAYIIQNIFKLNAL